MAPREVLFMASAISPISFLGENRDFSGVEFFWACTGTRPRHALRDADGAVWRGRIPRGGSPLGIGRHVGVPPERRREGWLMCVYLSRLSFSR